MVEEPCVGEEDEKTSLESTAQEVGLIARARLMIVRGDERRQSGLVVVNRVRVLMRLVIT